MNYSEKYLISFSGGRTSAFMTNELLKDESIANNSVIVFANTGRENDGTLDFVNECDKLWGGKVIWIEYCSKTKFRIVNYKTAHRISDTHQISPFEDMIEQKKFLPNAVARFCTQELKVMIIKYYLISIGWDNWTNVIGIRFDEPRRYSNAKEIETKERWLNWYPLYHWKITKPMVLRFWKGMPFDLQVREEDGNCDLCMLKGRQKKIKILRQRPDVATWWKAMEVKYQATWHKLFSIDHLLKKIDSQPLLFDYEEEDIPCICNND